MHKLTFYRIGKRMRWFVNGDEVNERTYVVAAAQNVRIRQRRALLQAGRWVRPWNSLDPRNEYLRRFGKSAAFPHKFTSD